MAQNFTQQNHRWVAIVFSFLWVSTTLGQAINNGDATRLSFGRVMPDERIEQVIAFLNPGSEPLVIENIQLTPPLTAEDITYLILPGAEGSFKLVLGKERRMGNTKAWYV